MSKALDAKEFEAKLHGDREMINERLYELLPSCEDPPVSLHEAMRYSTLSGGKRLRGVLCLAAHNISGNSHPAAALDAACAIECFHTYTLIHDDLPSLDDDAVRRGKPSCHVKFGEAIAILAGDALQALAFDILSRCPAPETAVNEALRILSRTAGSLFLVGGQVADLEGEGKEPTADRVSFIHSRKTAELVAASLSIGAALAGASENRRLQMHAIGRDVGFAFQIVDDLLDLEGTEELVGKGLRKDSKREKITYPACFGVKSSREKACRLIDDAVSGITKLGGQGYIQQLFELIVGRVS